jgi:hypothetical protein
MFRKVPHVRYKNKKLSKHPRPSSPSSPLVLIIKIECVEKSI